jgi:hypothetical protein
LVLAPVAFIASASKDSSIWTVVFLIAISGICINSMSILYIFYVLVNRLFAVRCQEKNSLLVIEISNIELDFSRA